MVAKPYYHIKLHDVISSIITDWTRTLIRWMSTAQWPDIHLVWIDQYPIKYLSTSHISRHWYDGGSCLISSVRHCVSPLTLWWWWLWITVVLLSDCWWIYYAVSMCVQYEVDNFLQINQKKTLQWQEKKRIHLTKYEVSVPHTSQPYCSNVWTLKLNLSCVFISVHMHFWPPQQTMAAAWSLER